MREWLTERREAAQERSRLDAKQRALLGTGSGGSGVTVTMRRISGEAASREPVWIVRHQFPNREARRRGARSLGQNKPYVRPAVERMGEDA